VVLVKATAPNRESCRSEPQLAWLRAHTTMFDFFGGSVPRLVPGNLKTGVISHPSEGEIVLKDAYREMAAHYSASVLPGRVRCPKDKPSVENTVSHVATWVIAGFSHEQFTSLAQLRVRIYEQTDAYNRQPFQKCEESRLSVFTTEEKLLMHALPASTLNQYQTNDADLPEGRSWQSGADPESTTGQPGWDRRT
jgi:transposase